jgi:hypothetical protein
MENENTNEVLTLREVARILKCRTNQIYELSRRRGQERSTKPLPVLTRSLKNEARPPQGPDGPAGRTG